MSDHTTVSFAVAGPTGSSVAVLPRDGGLTLPTVDIPAKVWFPDVESVLGALRDEHRIEALALDCLHDRRDPDSPSVEMCYLLELRPGFAMPATTRWVPDTDQVAASHRELAASALRTLALHRGRPATPDWTAPGWYAEATAWVEARLAAAGRSITGSPAQVRTWGLSTVLRCPTDRGNVYFKATAHTSTIRPARPDPIPLLFAHEPRVLRMLSADRPGTVPAPLVVDEERVWMLLPDLGRVS